LQTKLKVLHKSRKEKTKPNNFSSRQKEKKAATENRKKKRRSNDRNSNRHNRNQNPNTMHTSRASPLQAEDGQSSQYHKPATHKTAKKNLQDKQNKEMQSCEWFYRFWCTLRRSAM
jgi:hypothetical protein